MQCLYITEFIYRKFQPRNFSFQNIGIFSMASFIRLYLEALLGLSGVGVCIGLVEVVFTEL